MKKTPLNKSRKLVHRRMKQIRTKKPVFIFDIGGVVVIWSDNDPIFNYIAKRYNIPFTRLKSVMSESIEVLEEGKIGCSEFVRRSLARFGKKLKRSDTSSRLITRPLDLRTRSRLGVIRIIRGLRKLGYEVDAFSNTNSSHVKLLKRKGWTTPLFNNFFASCDIGALKPSVKAFRIVLERIGASPDEVVFIDNLNSNILGARRAGITNSIQFHSIKDLKVDLKRVIQNYNRLA